MNTVYTFDQHEYLLLLGLLNSQMVLGIEYPYSSPEEEQAAMERAVHSLQEKGHVVRKHGRVEIAPEIVSFVSVCASPQYVLTAVYGNANKEQDVRFIHFSEQGIVEDRVLPSGIRQLTAIPASEQVVERVSQQFHLQDQPAAPGEPCTLAPSALETIRESVEKGKEEIALQIQQAGANASLADSLAGAFVAPVSNSTLTKVRIEQETRAESFALLESAEGLLEMHFSGEEQVHLTPVNAEIAIQMIASYVS